MFYFFSIFFLSLFDIIATHYQIVVFSTFEIEANPFMRWVMYEYGIVGAYLVRMALPCITVPFLLWVCERDITTRERQFSTWTLRLALLIHVLLALWHFYVTQCFTLHG